MNGIVQISENLLICFYALSKISYLCTLPTTSEQTQ